MMQHQSFFKAGLSGSRLAGNGREESPNTNGRRAPGNPGSFVLRSMESATENRPLRLARSKGEKVG